MSLSLAGKGVSFKVVDDPSIDTTSCTQSVVSGSVSSQLTKEVKRQIDPGDIVRVMPHWREGEACYASLTLRSGEQVTGLVVTADIDALLSDWHGEGSDEPPPIAV